MFIFESATYEEGNHMLRMYKESHFHYIRVAICNEDFDEFFFHKNTQPLIEYIGNLISDNGGIKLGNRRLNFIGYSNSQLKKKSFWFLCENDPVMIQTESKAGHKTIGKMRIARMGIFEKERNTLKRYARIGQFFSVSKEICTLEES